MSGSTVDPRIALGIQAPQLNPLAGIMQAAQTASAFTDAQRRIQELAAQRLIGTATQNALNPETGELDRPRFMQGLQGNPMAGFMAPDALSRVSQAQGLQLQAQTQAAQLSMIRLDHLSQSLTGLLERPQLTRQDVLTHIERLASLPPDQRPFTPQVAAAFLGNLPEDNQGIRQRLFEIAGSVRQNQERLRDFLPQPQYTSDGRVLYGLNTNPRSPGALGPQLEMQPSVETTNAPLARVGPNGQIITGPAGQALPFTGGLGTPTPGTVGAGSPQLPSAPGGAPAAQPPTQGHPVFGTGRYPGADQPTPPPAAQTPSGASLPGTSSPPGTVTTQLPPGTSQALQGEGVSSVERSAALSNRAAQAPVNLANLQHMRSLLAQFASGAPGASLTRQAVTALNSVLPPDRRIRVDATSHQEEFNKLAERMAQDQARTFGAGSTNMELGSALRTVPNEGLSNLGNDRIIAHLLGNELAIQTKDRAWQAWRGQNGPESFAQFETDFNRRFDPRVFQTVFMDGASRRAMLSHMPAEDRARFNTALNHAISQGWINRDLLGLPPETPGGAPVSRPAPVPVRQLDVNRLEDDSEFQRRFRGGAR